MNMNKLNQLLRYHRANVFHENDFVADCHSRALRRLKNTRIFKDEMEKRDGHAKHVAGQKLLYTYA